MQFILMIFGLAINFLLLILPVLNGYYVGRLFDKRWQKVVLGFGLGLATFFLNCVIFYCLFIVIGGKDVFLGEVSDFKCFISYLVTLAICGSFTCLLYILGIRKRKRKSSLIDK